MSIPKRRLFASFWDLPPPDIPPGHINPKTIWNNAIPAPLWSFQVVCVALSGGLCGTFRPIFRFGFSRCVTSERESAFHAVLVPDLSHQEMPNMPSRLLCGTSRFSRCVTSGRDSAFHSVLAPDLSHQEMASYFSGNGKTIIAFREKFHLFCKKIIFDKS